MAKDSPIDTTQSNFDSAASARDIRERHEERRKMQEMQQRVVASDNAKDITPVDAQKSADQLAQAVTKTISEAMYKQIITKAKSSEVSEALVLGSLRPDKSQNLTPSNDNRRFSLIAQDATAKLIGKQTSQEARELITLTQDISRKNPAFVTNVLLRDADQKIGVLNSHIKKVDVNTEKTREATERFPAVFQQYTKDIQANTFDPHLIVSPVNQSIGFLASIDNTLSGLLDLMTLQGELAELERLDRRGALMQEQRAYRDMISGRVQTRAEVDIQPVQDDPFRKFMKSIGGMAKKVGAIVKITELIIGVAVLGSLSYIYQNWDKFSTLVTNSGSLLGQFVELFRVAWVEGFMPLFGELGRVLSEWWNTDGTKLSDIAKDLLAGLTVVGHVMFDIADFFITWALPAILRGTIRNLRNGIDVVRDVYNSVRGIFGSGPNAKDGIFYNIGRIMWDLDKFFIKTIDSLLSTLIDALGLNSFFGIEGENTLFSTIGNFFVNLYEKVVAMLISINPIPKIESAYAEFRASFIKFFVDIKDFVVGLFTITPIVNAIDGAFNQVVTTVTNVFSDIGTMVTDMYESTKEFFASLSPLETIKNNVKSLIDAVVGLIPSGDDLKGFAMDMINASYMPQTIKDWLLSGLTPDRPEAPLSREERDGMSPVTQTYVEKYEQNAKQDRALEEALKELQGTTNTYNQYSYSSTTLRDAPKPGTTPTVNMEPATVTSPNVTLDLGNVKNVLTQMPEKQKELQNINNSTTIIAPTNNVNAPTTNVSGGKQSIGSRAPGMGPAQSGFDRAFYGSGNTVAQ